MGQLEAGADSTLSTDRRSDLNERELWRTTPLDI